MRRYLWTLIAAIGGAIVWQTAVQDARGAKGRCGQSNRDRSGRHRGLVTSSKGPEAGVWVIAETTDLPTKVRKIVVTDDQGRYLLPDLPKANYDVWVRGYGLWIPRRFDSRQVKIERSRPCSPPLPGRRRNTIRRAIGIPSSRFRPKAIFPERVRRETESVPRWRPSTTGSIRSKRTATSVTSWAIRQRGKSRRLSALLPPASMRGTAVFR